ncbi:MAG: SWIM zinc finger family protein [Candidatus Anstonellales archaeon]
MIHSIILWMRRLVIVNKQVLQRKCNYELLEITAIDENGVYAVKNCKKDTEYLVTIAPDTCTCHAYQYNAKCKHINAVKDVMHVEKHASIAIVKTEDLMVLD